jgi:5-methylcytosine-specific restriction protein A
MPVRPPRHRAPHQKGKAHSLEVWKRFNAKRETSRSSAKARGYGKDWQALRAIHLAREPDCRACAEAGIERKARIVDHIESIAARPELRLDPANLQSLCWPCHNAKTIRRDGGFGRPRQTS